uniref:IGv domain-containing protein n=1 Tax=Heterorhabditis bacteriophora TaxID=37862 RepID=A0A1I7WIU4_HETBA
MNSPETLNPCVSLLNYLWKIVTGDEKWIMYNNRKCTHSWVDPGQPTTSTPERPSVHLVGYKTCAVLLTPLPGETVTTECYFRQLIKLKDHLPDKEVGRSFCCMTTLGLTLLLVLSCEILPYAAYSVDLNSLSRCGFYCLQADVESESYPSDGRRENILMIELHFVYYGNKLKLWKKD